MCACCPPWQDETGEEGVLIMPQDGSKKVRVGGKVSVSKNKMGEQETAGAMREAFERQASVAKVEAIDEAEGLVHPSLFDISLLT